MGGRPKSRSPSRRNSQTATSSMYGPSSAIWIPPIRTGYWWRLRATCPSKRSAMKARLFLVLLCAAAMGCTVPPPPQPVGLRLARVSFSSLPEWNPADAALTSFQRSCALLMEKSDATPLSGAGYAGTVADWRGACAPPYANKTDARNFFEQNFTPFAVEGEAL